ncbi:MAG: UDP-N-acetyl-D-glucosamine 2-epimerase, UDP-hydrolysing [Candidatus Yanofskybacteria bacterium RIFCSPHIGHO2_01_FULL_39_8b]|uniref:UDP-N-acetyl-D-glucosamine 2-epimerase, UDP-hydrolysing n=1 Tax=Candidatus Yanofskybacteria bacterium RIFCSPHIGHO2_01_FULL_39_8b TaxID=1802659 RepID=A0A1F8EG43_9BACT|nr:MAG: UDP-N-acetyl-D-glucosamine 2-epimerase, UDP-hydrolysing [Candidatus Yanofskybacteria bacterium RIFCSPHIGHO2_01_FULL_39_8b]
MDKRKICFVITSSIHYSRSKLILSELKNRDNVELQIIVGASAILPNYGDILELMERDGFSYNEKITMTLEGGNPVAMAKTTGIGIIEFTTVFDNLKPDVVIVRGDRYEVLSAAIAAAYLNIPVAHIEGGDVTGTIDESVRHAVTKLAHIHFPTNDLARQRIIRMGEPADYIFNFGSPELEFVAKNSYEVSNELINKIGVGDAVDITKPYLMVMQHSVTSEIGYNRENIEKTLDAIHELGIPAIWFWPNVDAGTDEISKGIRVFREHQQPKNIRFIKSLPPEEFVGLLKNAACLVGNSSAGIKEASFLGTPVVNIGTRQNGRMKAENVIDVSYGKEEIKQAVNKQLDHGRYPTSNIYYQPDTAKKIVDTLSTIKLYVQKSFKD